MKFPEEIQVNILARLPIKDINRFKLVCKTWLKLISDPYFTRYHARNSPFAALLRGHGNNDVSLLEVAGNGKFTNVPLSPKLPPEPESTTTVIGSWGHSVFLLHRRPLSYKERVYVFDPVLGSCKIFTEDCWVRSTRFYSVEYKVGYIPSNSSYKLFRSITSKTKYKYRRNNNDDPKEAAEVLTVGLDKDWRKKDESLRHVLETKQVVCMNGAFHWVSEDKKDKRVFLCTYDLLEEKINGDAGISLPHGVSSRASVTILNNSCLSVVDRPDHDTMVIWRMKEYGVVESWSRVIVLTLNSNAWPKYKLARYFLPVAVYPNGNILCTEKERKGIFIFSVEKKQWTQLMYPDPKHTETSYVNTCAPTLTQGGGEIIN